MMIMVCVVAFDSFDIVCFFFKQKTAYEMRISDWSSDVCSSDLVAATGGVVGIGYWDAAVCDTSPASIARAMKHVRDLVGIPYVALEIGRASCRERVCQYV